MKLHYITLHHITLHYIALHYIHIYIYIKVQDATATQQLALFLVIFQESVVHPLYCRFALDV